MSPSNIPAGGPLPPVVQRVIPLHHELGVRGGHQLILLSLEVWEGWADLRFARIDLGGGQTLKRRIPPAEAWRISLDDEPVTVHDAVGRGDRGFSNGEVRLTRAPAPGQRLAVEVELLSGEPPLTTAITVPAPGSCSPPPAASGEPATGTVDD